MCIFTGERHVQVSSTNIFARMIEPGIQALAYSMNLSTQHEVAMVLPIPVAPGAGEDAVRFIDLQRYPKMFEELAQLFMMPMALGPPMLGRGMAPHNTLKVHTVGSFIASYVPTRADFERLDPRFRLPEALFEAVPQYASDYGFAVFQLSPGDVTVHPMAFTFPTSQPDFLFFPTVHVHDGSFQPTAHFDHALYYQHPGCTSVDRSHRFHGDEVAFVLPSTSYRELVIPANPMLRQTLRGTLNNADTWIGPV